MDDAYHIATDRSASVGGTTSTEGADADGEGETTEECAPRLPGQPPSNDVRDPSTSVLRHTLTPYRLVALAYLQIVLTPCATPPRVHRVSLNYVHSVDGRHNLLQKPISHNK